MILLEAFGAFLVAHPELVTAMIEAIEGGLSHEAALKAIKDAQRAASEAVVTADIGPRP